METTNVPTNNLVEYIQPTGTIVGDKTVIWVHGHSDKTALANHAQSMKYMVYVYSPPALLDL